MQTQLTKSIECTNGSTIFLCPNANGVKSLPLSAEEKEFAEARLSGDCRICRIQHLEAETFIAVPKCGTGEPLQKHDLQKTAVNIYSKLTEHSDCAEVAVKSLLGRNLTLAFVESLILSDYHFDRYKSKKDHRIGKILLCCDKIGESDISELNNLCESIACARDWVNEPIMQLNAEKFGDILKAEAEKLGAKATVLSQHQIEALKMGGILGVNRGSKDEARFMILEWAHPKAHNDKPIVLVGKGIMYDTGGLNIKTGNYMNDMKSDMAGAATMAGAFLAAVRNNLPVNLKVLIPATDNRPNGNAYANGDILTMYDGTTVEVVNTDAEGRLILADAIAYANQYNPQVIIDAATLTGAAERAIGKYGIVAMHQDAGKEMQELVSSGEDVYERIAEFPFWEEYGELIKSDVADIKNSGTGVCAGMITAGKFLAHFAKAPFIHLDIAGVAFADKKYEFYGTSATGFGIRLLYNWLKTI